MKQILITTYNKKLYDEYAHQLVDTFIQTNQLLPLYVFTEDDTAKFPKRNGVTYINLFEEEPESLRFKERNKGKPVGVFFEDAVRFSYKVFAQSAARKYGDKVYYVDSDCKFISQIPWQWYKDCLPDETFLSFYNRHGQYTETGFVAFNHTREVSDEFMTEYKRWYLEDSVYNIEIKGKNFWTDCHTLDRTRQMFKERENYTEKSLGDGRHGHIMARDRFIRPYLDHRKGARKYKQWSPEWRKNI